MSDNALSAIQAVLLRLEQGQQQLADGQYRLTEGQHRLGERQERVEQTVTDLRVALMDRMDRLQDSLAGIRDDVGVNMHHSDRVRAAHDHTREELRSMGDSVAQLHIRLRKLEEAVRLLKGDP